MRRSQETSYCGWADSVAVLPLLISTFPGAKKQFWNLQRMLPGGTQGGGIHKGQEPAGSATCRLPFTAICVLLWKWGVRRLPACRTQ